MSFFGSYSWTGPPGLQGLQQQAQQIGQTDWATPQQRWGLQVGKWMNQPGKLAKHPWDSDPVFASYMDPIRNAYASNVRDMTRSAEMTPVSGQQVGLINAQKQNAITRAGDQEGMAMEAEVPNIINFAANQAAAGKATNLGATEFSQSAQDQLEQLYKQQYNPGILDRIGQVAGVVGQIEGDAMGIGGLTAGMGGGGGMGGPAAGDITPGTPGYTGGAPPAWTPPPLPGGGYPSTPGGMSMGGINPYGFGGWYG